MLWFKQCGYWQYRNHKVVIIQFSDKQMPNFDSKIPVLLEVSRIKPTKFVFLAGLFTLNISRKVSHKMGTVLWRCEERQIRVHTCVMLDENIIFTQPLLLPVVCGWPGQPTTSLALSSLNDSMHICIPSPHHFTCLVPLFSMIPPINTILNVYLTFWHRSFTFKF
jgi:hypothetical protein